MLLKQSLCGLVRLIFAFLLLTVLILPPAQAVTAAPAREIVLSFDIVAVKANESVTVRLKDFPVRTNFSVKMAKVGKKAVDGAVIAEFNTEKGGTFEATYAIPEALKGQLILAIRFDSVDHYTADNWFFNRDLLAKPTASAAQPALTFSDVKKNNGFTFNAKNLAPNTMYAVRVGPHYTFYRDYISLPALRSDQTGTLTASLSLPERAKNAEAVMLRLDGGGTYLASSYANIDGGTILPAAQLVKVINCTLLQTKPLPSLAPGEEFDVTWKVQNTSNRAWDAQDLLYRYTSGERMHKYADLVSVGWTVEKGWSFDIMVDMVAPREPGWHSTVWNLLLDDQPGDQILCKLPVSVFVKEP